MVKIVEVSSGKQLVPFKGKTQPIVEVVQKKAKKSKKSKKAKKGKNPQGRPGYPWNLSNGNAIASNIPIINYLKAPDVFGPIRLPRAGGAGAKTGLGMIRSQAQITGSATNTIQGIIGVPSFNVGYIGSTLTATTATTALTVSNTITYGEQFPSASQVDDVTCNALSLVVSYLGSPLNAQGEIIFGTVAVDNTFASTATYSGLYFYPGFLKLPVAKLIETPIRVFMTKASYDATSFLSPTSLQPDCNRPLIITSGLPTGGTVNVEITGTFEYRSSVTAGNVVPYEMSGTSFSKEVDQLQDTVSNLVREPFNGEPALNEYIREFAMGSIGSLANTGLMTAGTALLGVMGNHHMRRLRGGSSV
jgi:hypothetical protein